VTILFLRYNRRVKTNEEIETRPKRHAGGRPLKPLGRGGRVYCRLTQEERAAIEALAARSSLTIDVILKRGIALVMAQMEET